MPNKEEHAWDEPPARRVLFLGSRRLGRKGHSLQITVPTEVVKFFNLKKGDSITYWKQERENRVFIIPGKQVKMKIPGAEEEGQLPFSISADLFSKMLQDR